jgi:hypothetical protein
MTHTDEDVPLCNIQKRGARDRYATSAVIFTFGVAVTIWMNQVHPNTWLLRAILFPIFIIACTTFAQAPARTCVVNAVIAVTEDEQKKFKRIRSNEVVLALRLRALGVIVVGTVMGLIFGGLAFASSRLILTCRASPPTCSISYV